MLNGMTLRGPEYSNSHAKFRWQQNHVKVNGMEIESTSCSNIPFNLSSLFDWTVADGEITLTIKLQNLTSQSKSNNWSEAIDGYNCVHGKFRLFQHPLNKLRNIQEEKVYITLRCYHNQYVHIDRWWQLRAKNFYDVNNG